MNLPLPPRIRQSYPDPPRKETPAIYKGRCYPVDEHGEAECTTADAVREYPSFLSFLRKEDLRYLKDNDVMVIIAPHLPLPDTTKEIIGGSDCENKPFHIWVANDVATSGQVESFNHEVAHCKNDIEMAKKGLKQNKFTGLTKDTVKEWGEAPSEIRAEKFAHRMRKKLGI